MKPETQRWLSRAAEDMGMADMAWERRYYASCIFHCQQAIEKTLKGGLIEREGDYPKIHDLPDLARQLGLRLAADRLTFLARLSEQYIATRYDDEWLEIPRDVAQNYYQSSKDIYSWLLQELS